MKKILEKLKYFYSLIPFYLRSIVVFSIIVLIANVVVEKTKPVDYWETELGKAQEAEMKRMIEREKLKNSQNINQEITVNSENNSVSVEVKELNKSSPYLNETERREKREVKERKIKTNPKEQKEKITQLKREIKEKNKGIFYNTGEDIIFGSSKSPVTIIEYSSYSCPHCINFHKNSMSELMKNYVEKDKIKYVKRMIPQKNTFTAVILPYCLSDKNKRYSLINDLYKNSEKWMKNKKELKKIALNNGFSEKSYNDCIKNRELAQKITDRQRKQMKEVRIFFTPTIFINGEKVSGSLSYEELSKKIDEEIKKFKK